MKSPFKIATLVLCGAIMVGCQSQSRTSPSQPISAEGLERLRSEFAIADPSARVGAVEAVLPSSMYLTVGQISVADFPEGTAVSIVDSNRQVVTYGVVVKTFESSVHVKYDKSARAPKVGDVAVHF